MEWLSQNWLWVLIGIAFIGMHLFGHGGHGGHDGNGRSEGRRDRGSAAPTDKDAAPTHRH